MKIISRLRGGSSALEIIPIVGMGGMGKTTLARNAYNHPLIMEHFDVRVWCTASSDDDWRRIILNLLPSTDASWLWRISKRDYELMVRVYQILYERRYLFVIDDIWSLEAWDDLKFVLPDDGNGSRVILTTRVMDLAESAGRIHEMDFLDEDKTWNLFRQKIFKGDPCPSQLEYVGKMIARSCRGHPLSIEVVSGILAADQTEATWEDVSENIMKIASENDEVVRDQILSLSYTYLPHHLRPCFLYLACFPDNQEIRVSKLVRLWVAEGFMNESESKSFEETGEEHVEDLVQRNVVSVSKRKCNGRIKSIAIHDVMRDVCLRQAYTDSFNLHVSRFHSFDRQELLWFRRVSNFFYGDDFLEGVYGSTIRTIILCLEDSRVRVMRWSIGNVRLLRILDLSNTYNYDLAEEVFELFHLRYLAFHYRNCILEAISKLQNLQTLIICPGKRNFGKIGKLAEGIWRMPQLRHLVMFPFELPSQREGTSALENLQTLSVLVDFICSRENLKMIPNLKKLAVFTDKINNSVNAVVEDYQHGNLKYLQKLEILKIKLHKITSCNVFPPTLKKLSLIDVGLLWEDMKIVGLLPNLQVLKLKSYACSDRTWETSEGGFSQLTYLLIEESDLEHWITETSHFPGLKSLVLHQCLRLLEVPNDIGRISTLELVELDDKNQSLLSSVKQIQKDRQSLEMIYHLQIIVV